MRRLIWDDPELIAWAEARIPQSRFRPDAVAVGVADAHEVRGVFVWDTFSTRSAFMHVASDGSRSWLSRSVLVQVFAQPFLAWGFNRISCIIAASNGASLRFAEALGCKREGLMRQAAPDGGDYVMLGLLKRECVFLPENNPFIFRR